MSLQIATCDHQNRLHHEQLVQWHSQKIMHFSINLSNLPHKKYFSRDVFVI